MLHGLDQASAPGMGEDTVFQGLVATGTRLAHRATGGVERDMSSRALLPAADSSARDPLTRVFNRGYLVNRLILEIAHAVRTTAQAAILMADIDRLKQVNDRFGRFVGDRALLAVAGQIQRTIGLEDLLGRYGGDEFVILARGTSTSAAAALAERVRRNIESLSVIARGEPVPMTISVGVASLTELAPADDHMFALLALAEGRMNGAKASGRNRISPARTQSQDA